jgi:hypothetical protein
MIRYGKLSVKEVLDAISPDLLELDESALKKIRSAHKLNFSLANKTYDLNLASHRLTTFKKHSVNYKVACTKCGATGSFFAAEAHVTENPHLNLYAEDNGKEVLMIVKDFAVKCLECEVKVEPRKKIGRNLSTEESREYWAAAERTAAEVSTWPDWKRAGINVSDIRSKPRI